MKDLHPTQESLLKLLAKTIDEPLTIREMQERLNISQPSVVLHHIRQLVKKGYLKRNPNNSKDYQIIKDGPEKNVVPLNLYGLAHCGPHGSILTGDPIDRIPITTRLLTFPASEAFLVKAKGGSMEPKIHNNDFVIVRKTPEKKVGSIVVCVNDEEALIKKLELKDRKYFLMSLNNEYPSFFAAKDFKVEGEVKGVISYQI